MEDHAEIASMDITGISRDTNSSWPMVKGNPRGTGCSDVNTSDNIGMVKWVFGDEENQPWTSPVIGPDGTIYSGSGDHYMYAVNPNGTLKWKFEAGHIIDEASAVDSNGTIYFGSASGLYAVYPNGTQKWHRHIGHSNTHPMIGPDDMLYYVDSRDYRLYAIYPNGSVKWTTLQGGFYASSPAIGSDGTIYIGSHAPKLYAIYPNGTIKWTFDVGDNILSSPAVADDDTVYFGAWDGYLYAVYPNGTEKWKQYIGRSGENDIYSSPIIGPDESILVINPWGNLLKFHTNSSLVWLAYSGRTYSTPAVDMNGMIYQTDLAIGSLYSNRTLKWKFQLEGTCQYNSPAIGPDGTIYTTASDRHLYAIGNRPPLTPSSMKVSSGIGDVKIYWEQSLVRYEPDIDEYRVYRGTDGGELSLLCTVNGSARFFNDTDVENGRNYTYRVSGVNMFGESDLSDPVWAIPYGIPGSPLNIELEVGNMFVVLSWEGPADLGGADLLGFNIYRGTTPDNLTFLKQLGPLVHSYNDTDLPNGQDHHYAISAFTHVHESPLSKIVTGTPVTFPHPPINVKCNECRSYVIIEWDPPNFDGGTPITGYELYRDGKLLSELEADTHRYNDSDLEYGVEYRYCLRSVNAVGISEWSWEVYAVIRNVPTVPLDLSGISGDGFVLLSWSASEDMRGSQIQGYRLYRKQDGEFQLVIYTAQDDRHYNDTDVLNGVTYHYMITAQNSVGESDRTVPVSFTPLGLPSSPRNIHIREEKQSVILSWDVPV